MKERRKRALRQGGVSGENDGDVQDPGSNREHHLQERVDEDGYDINEYSHSSQGSDINEHIYGDNVFDIEEDEMDEFGVQENRMAHGNSG